ncbi:MAG TPA: CPBP family intramembrane glutamic endopeptidase [Chlamydiales bacterium]|nr:CPBP family intramembrane glutamic endopeptidase [Chlamydiales bacterium]
MAAFISFIFLGLAFLSVWVRRDLRIWMSLFFASVIAAMMGGNILPVGVLVLFGWVYLWFFYTELKSISQFLVFLVIILASYAMIFQLVPGFDPVVITPKFRMGIQKPMVLLFPLALLVPVARTWRDWKKAFRGLLYGCLGIGVMALLATAAGATHWQMKLPPSAWIIYLNNLIFVAIPEEAFFRGFIQNQVCRYLNNKFLGLLIASAIFTLAHVYWSPNATILAFVFIAGLLYGGVYLLTEKIESAILTHFLLNFIHMTFFAYHAL